MDGAGFENAAPYQEQIGVANPLFGAIGDNNRDTSDPFFADLDGDGDLDAIVGTRINVRYFENTGTTSAPVFTERLGNDNPLNFIDLSVENSAASPALVDLDADGDLDAIIAASYSEAWRYYENIGTALAPVFISDFTGIDVGSASDPALVDLDGDGDLDAIVGNRNGNFRYFVNIAGPGSDPLFTEQTGAANPFNGVDVGDRATSTFADLTGDGVIDVITGARDGTLRFYLNTGTALAPVLTQQAGAANPFNGLDVGQASTPELADVDGDGDLDAVIGGFTSSGSNGVLRYFENTGTTSAPVFVERTGAANPFNSFVGLRNPVLADVDGDGDLDAAVGTGPTQRIRDFENTGTTSAPVYVERTGAANPFDAVVERDARFDLADVDGDGDLDAAVGDQQGNINYFINVGTATTPVFTAVNPFFNLNIRDARPAFADLDNDGDFDLLVGVNSGPLRYFVNIGTSSEATYVELTGANNPFIGFAGQSGRASDLTFVDHDQDGDFDLVVGDRDGFLSYFENIGTASGASVRPAHRHGQSVQWRSGHYGEDVARDRGPRRGWPVRCVLSGPATAPCTNIRRPALLAHRLPSM